MKNNNFDDAIRRKLEGFDQTFTEQEVNTVFQKVNKMKHSHWTIHFIKSPWFIAPLSVAAMITATHLTITRINHSEILSKKIVVTSPVNNNTQETLVVTDTVILPIKKAEKKFADSAIYTNIRLSDTITKTNTYLPSNKKAITADITDTIQPEKKYNPQVDKIQNVQQTHAQIIPTDSNHNQESISSLNKTLKFKQLNKDEVGVNRNRDEAKNNSSIILNDTVNHAQNNLVDKIYLNQTNDTLSSKIDTMPEQSVQLDSTNQKDSLTVNVLENKISTEDSTQFIKDSSRYMYYRIAVKGLVSNESYNIGLIGEILAGKHWSFITGIQYKGTFTEEYKNNQELAHRYHHMPEKIEKHMNNNNPLTNVIIKNTIIQLPIAFAYYQPMQNNYKFFCLFGTDIDIYLNQKINYTHRDDAMKEHKGHFNAKANTVAFNNLVIIAGLERKWNHFAVQLCPFISPQIKGVPYKPKEYEYGIGINLFYSPF